MIESHLKFAQEVIELAKKYKANAFMFEFEPSFMSQPQPTYRKFRTHWTAGRHGAPAVAVVSYEEQHHINI